MNNALFDTVVFDLGNVLISFNPRWLFRKMLPDEGYDVDDVDTMPETDVEPLEDTVVTGAKVGEGNGQEKDLQQS